MSDCIARSKHAQYVDARVFVLWGLEQAWVKGRREGRSPARRAGSVRGNAASVGCSTRPDREVDLFLI